MHTEITKVNVEWEREAWQVSGAGCIYDSSRKCPGIQHVDNLYRLCSICTSLSHVAATPFHTKAKMHFRTLAELGHSDRPVQLIDSKPVSAPECCLLTLLEASQSHGTIHLVRSDVILVPQPSTDVNDPLRWPNWKKICVFLNICVFTAMVTGYVSGFSPALYLLGIEFKTDLQQTSGLVTWPLLTAGLGVG
jgi:hypothetical protein